MADSERPRKRRWWLFLLVLGFFFFLPILGVMSLMSRLDGGGTVVMEGTVLELHLSGDLPEAPGDPFIARLTGDSPLSVWGLRQALRSAANDPLISGVRVVIEPVQMGWAAAEEVVYELDKFKAAGKPIHAFLQVDILEEKELFLASSADRIWMIPGSGALINGLSTEVLFWRGTLDKLNVEPEVIMFHEYKSAGEPMVNKEMSPYMRESMGALLTDIQQRFVDRMVEKRGIQPEQLDALLVRGLSSTAELKDLGLIDEIGYIDQIDDLLAGLSDSGTYQGLNITEYLESRPQVGPSSAKVAVVFAEGPILASSGGDSLFGNDSTIYGPNLAAQLREAIDDPSVDAIVLRISSPGGSAVGSDLVWRETQRAKEAGIPIIISMSNVAASGGYWISMGADAIVAQPTTITGSIGVVFQKFNVNGLLEMIGANADSISSAPMADLFTLTAPLTPERRKLVTDWIGGTYADFTRKVSEGRGLPLEKVQEIAKGRVWSGTDALEQGLVDKLGGIDTAVAIAAERLNVPAEEVLAVPFPETSMFLDRLLGGGALQAAATLNTLVNGPSKAQTTQWLRTASTPSIQASMPEVWIH